MGDLPRIRTVSSAFACGIVWPRRGRCSTWSPRCATSSCSSCWMRPTPGARAAMTWAPTWPTRPTRDRGRIQHVPRKTSPMSALRFYRLDGAYSRVGDGQTHSAAAARRDTPPSLSGSPRTPGRWPPSAAGSAASGRPARHRRRRQLYQQHARILRRGIRGSYGSAKYQRLASIKAEYDPGNMSASTRTSRRADRTRPVAPGSVPAFKRIAAHVVADAIGI